MNTLIIQGECTRLVLAIEGEYTNHTRGIEAYISYRILVLFYLKSLSMVAS